MEAGSALDPTPLKGFKDFYQYAGTTRVIAGRNLLESTGFEFQKEGARRVFVVTDQVIRGTGLVERVEAGIVDGGLEVAGVFDDVPQDSSTEVCDRCAAAAKEAGRRLVPRPGRRLGDGHREGGRRGLHARRRRARAGGLLPHAARGRRHGPAARDRPARLHPHDRGHRQRGVDGGRDQGAGREREDRDRRLPALPAARDPRPGHHAHAAAGRGGRHRHGRDDPRDRGLRVGGLEPAPGRALAPGAAHDPRQPRARPCSAARRTRRRAATC